MKVYLPRDAADPYLRHLKGRALTVFVSPGAHHPEVSDWMEGGAPKMFQVQFRDGAAEVPKNLGEYMIRQSLARRTPLILPGLVA